MSNSNTTTQTATRTQTFDKQTLDPPFLAKPSGLCCLKGTIHSGTPRGSFIRVADVETYVVKPAPHKANGHILLYFPDVWGMFTNGLLVMDSFADAGYLTIGLDYFRGVSDTLHFTEESMRTVHHFISFAAKPMPRSRPRRRHLQVSILAVLGGEIEKTRVQDTQSSPAIDLHAICGVALHNRTKCQLLLSSHPCRPL